MAMVPMLLNGPHMIHGYTGLLGGADQFATQLERGVDPNSLWLNDAFLALGIVVTGLKSTISLVYSLNNDAANAQQYHQTALRLAAAYSNSLHTARQCAADNQGNAVNLWFKRCNAIILEEHHRWQNVGGTDIERLETIEELAQRNS